jgi:hypothetical protein
MGPIVNISPITTLKGLEGKVIVSVRWCKKLIEFLTTDGHIYTFHHYQECVESVVVEDITGDFKDLLGKPLEMAEFVTESGGDYWEPSKWTFYKFRTIKGDVTVRWHGHAYGPYGVSVHLHHREVLDPPTPEVEYDWEEAINIHYVVSHHLLSSLVRDALFEDRLDDVYALAGIDPIMRDYVLGHIEGDRTECKWFMIHLREGPRLDLWPTGQSIATIVNWKGLPFPDTIEDLPKDHPLST